MGATLTEKEFSQHVNTNYRVNVAEAAPIELELLEVKPHVSAPIEPDGMERFQIYFRGPANIFLPQGTYSFSHERMGDFDLFLVPVAKEESGFRYEAVFNYYLQE
jgi:hypothetical protein